MLPIKLITLLIIGFATNYINSQELYGTETSCAQTRVLVNRPRSSYLSYPPRQRCQTNSLQVTQASSQPVDRGFALRKLREFVQRRECRNSAVIQQSPPRVCQRPTRRLCLPQRISEGYEQPFMGRRSRECRRNVEIQQIQQQPTPESQTSQLQSIRLRVRRLEQSTPDRRMLAISQQSQQCQRNTEFQQPLSPQSQGEQVHSMMQTRQLQATQLRIRRELPAPRLGLAQSRVIRQLEHSSSIRRISPISQQPQQCQRNTEFQQPLSPQSQGEQVHSMMQTRQLQATQLRIRRRLPAPRLGLPESSEIRQLEQSSSIRRISPISQQPQQCQRNTEFQQPLSPQSQGEQVHSMMQTRQLQATQVRIRRRLPAPRLGLPESSEIRQLEQSSSIRRISPISQQPQLCQRNAELQQPIPLSHRVHINSLTQTRQFQASKVRIRRELPAPRLGLAQSRVIRQLEHSSSIRRISPISQQPQQCQRNTEFQQPLSPQSQGEQVHSMMQTRQLQATQVRIRQRLPAPRLGLPESSEIRQLEQSSSIRRISPISQQPQLCQRNAELQQPIPLSHRVHINSLTQTRQFQATKVRIRRELPAPRLGLAQSRVIRQVEQSSLIRRISPISQQSQQCQRNTELQQPIPLSQGEQVHSVMQTRQLQATQVRIRRRLHAARLGLPESREIRQLEQSSSIRRISPVSQQSQQCQRDAVLQQPIPLSHRVHVNSFAQTRQLQATQLRIRQGLPAEPTQLRIRQRLLPAPRLGLAQSRVIRQVEQSSSIRRISPISQQPQQCQRNTELQQPLSPQSQGEQVHSMMQTRQLQATQLRIRPRLPAPRLGLPESRVIRQVEQSNSIRRISPISQQPQQCQRNTEFRQPISQSHRVHINSLTQARQLQAIKVRIRRRLPAPRLGLAQSSEIRQLEQSSSIRRISPISQQPQQCQRNTEFQQPLSPQSQREQVHSMMQTRQLQATQLRIRRRLPAPRLGLAQSREIRQSEHSSSIRRISPISQQPQQCQRNTVPQQPLSPLSQRVQINSLTQAGQLQATQLRIRRGLPAPQLGLPESRVIRQVEQSSSIRRISPISQQPQQCQRNTEFQQPISQSHRVHINSLTQARQLQAIKVRIRRRLPAPRLGLPESRDIRQLEQSSSIRRISPISQQPQQCQRNTELQQPLSPQPHGEQVHSMMQRRQLKVTQLRIRRRLPAPRLGLAQSSEIRQLEHSSSIRRISPISQQPQQCQRNTELQQPIPLSHRHHINSLTQTRQFQATKVRIRRELPAPQLGLPESSQIRQLEQSSSIRRISPISQQPQQCQRNKVPQQPIPLSQGEQVHSMMQTRQLQATQLRIRRRLPAPRLGLAQSREIRQLEHSSSIRRISPISQQPQQCQRNTEFQQPISQSHRVHINSLTQARQLQAIKVRIRRRLPAPRLGLPESSEVRQLEQSSSIRRISPISQQPQQCQRNTVLQQPIPLSHRHHINSLTQTRQFQATKVRIRRELPAPQLGLPESSQIRQVEQSSSIRRISQISQQPQQCQRNTELQQPIPLSQGEQVHSMMQTGQLQATQLRIRQRLPAPRLGLPESSEIRQLEQSSSIRRISPISQQPQLCPRNTELQQPISHSHRVQINSLTQIRQGLTRPLPSDVLSPEESNVICSSGDRSHGGCSSFVPIVRADEDDEHQNLGLRENHVQIRQGEMGDCPQQLPPLQSCQY
ncbi:uncharacterized protein LOC119676387 [Teleopsis dalmanni]|uniref:uncharacterized protein LOC119676387 n=1 Tax=Teleopsis dalmanni TaxID=139649 RepID=UPI0018CC9312|nr:uncharacterized protein LOC119676387 [Teleopsis dalmanni]